MLAKGNMNIRPGDPVELVLYTGRRLPDAKAISIEPAGAILDDERAFLAKQNMDSRLKTPAGSARPLHLTLDREVDILRGGIICSANRIGSGSAVKGCNFGFNQSRGILIKASRGEISGNRMEGCWMSAILVCRSIGGSRRAEQRPYDHRQPHPGLRRRAHLNRGLRRRQRRHRPGRIHINYGIPLSAVVMPHSWIFHG